MHSKAHELRSKTKDELLQEIEDKKRNLAELRVSKATGAGAGKLMSIRTVRKNIARSLTVLNQKSKAEAQAAYKKSNGQYKKYVPLELRPKKTRAIRRALSKEQRYAKTASQKRRAANFPKRRFAVSA